MLYAVEPVVEEKPEVVEEKPATPVVEPAPVAPKSKYPSRYGWSGP